MPVISFQSTFAPELLTTLRIFWISANTNVRNSSGVVVSTLTPASTRRLRASEELRALTISVLRRATIGFGMPAGPNTQNHEVISNPGTPDSAIVGTSGSAAERLLLDTAIARMRPTFTIGIIVGMVAM